MLKEQELIAKAKAGKLIEKPEPKDKPQDLRQFDVLWIIPTIW